MSYILYGVVALLIFSAIIHLFINKIDLSTVAICLMIIVLSYSAIVGIDYIQQTNDYEIWSGKVTKVRHEEEWDEWHPPRTETYTETDSKGNTVTKTREIPGYWEHHEAKNYITTSDEGEFRVYETLDGKKFNDSFVNSNTELEEYYPVGMATASVHNYENKLKASYSIFKHKDIDLSDYEDMPEYPIQQNKLTVNRLIGDFKDKDKLSKYLDLINSNLNDTNNKNNKENIKSYKQVNLMFVNFGDKDESYGYALQDYWENGAKNDFIVTFGTDKNNKATWCYVFSWTDVEILKTDVREYIMSLDDLDNFTEIMDHISELIEKKFDRKEFKDFDYIQIETTTTSKIIMLIIFLGCCAFVSVGCRYT